MQIARVDPGDAGSVEAFYDVYCAVGVADAPETFVASPIEEIYAVLVEPTARFQFTAFLGRESGRPVASGWAAGFLGQNTDHMFVLPRVLPSERQTGYGSQMLDQLEEHARNDGRTILDCQSRWAARFGSCGAGSPTVQFSHRHGFSLGLVERIARLDLPMDGNAAAFVADELSRRGNGYSIRAWLGPVPDELLHGWAVMEAAVSSDAPTGELAFDADVPSAETVRDDERILAASGQTSVSAVALHKAEVVAYTEMIIQIESSEPARQSGTLVMRSHRGNRLGLAVKRAVIDLLARERPDVPATLTQTALSNEPMIAVNEMLGYHALEFIGFFQKQL